MEPANAYLQQWGLREDPFAPTADPAYFYASRGHRDCLARLWGTIDARHGVAVILGSYGTGKTTLLRKVLANMAAAPDGYTTAVIGAPIPSWTSFALLEAILAQFGLQPRAASFAEYMDTLYEFLLDQRENVCTLIIDDAQNLNRRGQLELLRLVQNIETARHKLLNLVLFAQTEWTEVLRAAPNFEQRISMTHILHELPLEEMRDFIEFRLQQAGAAPGTGPDFTDAALRALHAYSEGTPRVIVTLCRNTLLLAGQQQARQVGHELVIQAIEETTVPDPEKRARVAEAVQESHLEPRTTEAPQDADEPASPALRERQTREQRAAEMLLRGARQGGGGGA